MDPALARCGLALLVVALAPGCGGTETPAPSCEAEGDGLVVTADWLNGSLTLLSRPRLVAGCSADAAIVDRIDLSSYPAAPLQIEIAPDGNTALVTLTAGFFEGDGAQLVGSPEVPPGGELLIVDLAARRVLHEVVTTQVPMGIAIHPDGTRAFTANYGRQGAPGDSMSVIDLQTGSVLEEVQVGSFPEQVALSADGSVGIINLAGEGGVRVFTTADPSGTLSPLVATGKDPSDVVFVGSDAVVTNSAGFSYSVLDVSDPAAPLLRETVALPALIPYGVSALSGSAQVLLTGVLAEAKLIPVDLSQSPSLVGDLIDLPGGPFPLGVAIDAGDQHAFVAHSNDHTLSIVALDGGATHAVRWLDRPGPTYVALAP